MGLFTIFILIPIVVICALLSVVCLKVARQPITLFTVTIFTGSGGIVGVATIILWAVIFSKLDSPIKILGMFIVAGIFAVIAGLYASYLYTKHKKYYKKYAQKMFAPIKMFAPMKHLIIACVCSILTVFTVMAWTPHAASK